MEEDRVSYHESVRSMYEKIKKDKMNNVWDRYQAQGLGGDPDRRCPFRLGGVRCDLCSNGPCRSDASKDKRGVCGITADGMAMRMMLLRNVMGASTYHYHTDHTINTLRATAKGKTPFKISEPEKLRDLAERLGLEISSSQRDVALSLCDFVEEDFHRRYNDPSKLVEILAPKERQEVWSKLGIFPGGIYSEIMLATSSCLTNVDGYYASLALKAMRLGISMAYQSQLINEYCQDIIFKVPRPHNMRVDIGVLDPDYVNVLPNGHEPFIGFALIQQARQPQWQEKARSAGAKGLRIIANIETGQEMIQRWEMDEVFYGYTGNWLMQEAVLASGCVDLFAADMNCSMPIIPLYAQRYNFKAVPVSDAVAFEGIEDRIDYRPEEVETQAATLLEMAIENFKARKASVEPVRGLPFREATVGFSTESILEKLGGSIDPLIEAIRNGTIRGVAGLISCTTLRDRGQDIHSVRMAKELIKRDVLVLSMGCGNAAMQVAGLCSLEAKDLAGPGMKNLCDQLAIPPVLSFGTCTDTGRLADLLSAISHSFGGASISHLPVAAAAPEYMEQKATIDAIFALALGLYTYVNPVPTITGAPNLMNLLTVECQDLTGGKLNLDKDPVSATEAIVGHIEANRNRLGI
jgi:carbon-monoxide dehydrogenase catalytic subunit